MTLARVLLDAHAHLYACFALDEALHHANANLAAAATRLGVGEHWHGCLLCADLQNRPVDEILAPLARSSRFRVEESAGPEACSRCVVDDRTDRSLLLVFGTQVVTAENLELLVFGPPDAQPDGLSLEASVGLARDAAALAVLPWGFGKWLGARGRTVASFLEGEGARRRAAGRGASARAAAADLYVGDNGGRPALSRFPALLGAALERGVRNLPGSDPLPFPAQARRLGSSGAVLAGEIDCDGGPPSLASLGRLLALQGGQPPVFRRGESLPRFAVNQARMQWRKRVPSAAGPVARE